MALALRTAARSEVGMVREGNEDAAYAGSRLLIVADGMGGHAAGEVASAAAVAVLARLDTRPVPSDETELRALLDDAVADAGHSLRELVTADRARAGMGTTVTAVLLDTDRLAVLQIGDSRAYLLHEATLTQLTHDQTFVQALIDEGSITDEEARVHPQRNVMLQALDGRSEVTGVLSLVDVVPGDRVLVCSDGLSGVVSPGALRDGLFAADPAAAVQRLVDAALRAGAPDNVTVIVADVVEEPDGPDDHDPPGAVLLGAAAQPATGRPTAPGEPGQADAAAGPPLGRGRGAHRAPRRRWWFGLGAGMALALLAVAWLGYAWTQRQYFVGDDGGTVAIFRGVPDQVAGRSLSRVVQPSTVALLTLPPYEADQVRHLIAAASLADAQRILAGLTADASACASATPPPACSPGGAAGVPSPSPRASLSSLLRATVSAPLPLVPGARSVAVPA